MYVETAASLFEVLIFSISFSKVFFSDDSLEKGRKLLKVDIRFTCRYRTSLYVY